MPTQLQRKKMAENICRRYNCPECPVRAECTAHLVQEVYKDTDVFYAALDKFILLRHPMPNYTVHELVIESYVNWRLRNVKTWHTNNLDKIISRFETLKAITYSARLPHRIVMKVCTEQTTYFFENYDTEDILRAQLSHK